MYPWVVLTTSTLANPAPCERFGLTGTISSFSAKLDGFRGPSLTAPLAVATKKFTTDPLLKSSPLIVKSPPTLIGEVTESTPRLGVGVTFGVRVGVRVAVCV